MRGLFALERHAKLCCTASHRSRLISTDKLLKVPWGFSIFASFSHVQGNGKEASDDAQAHCEDPLVPDGRPSAGDSVIDISSRLMLSDQQPFGRIMLVILANDFYSQIAPTKADIKYLGSGQESALVIMNWNIFVAKSLPSSRKRVFSTLSNAHRVSFLVAGYR